MVVDSKTSGKVDLVYTYVDNSDSLWQASFKSAVKDFPEVPSWGVCDARFNPHDDLRFSLRSLGKFAPFIGHVYIVTDGQSPPWLNTSSGVTLVSHVDLFRDEGSLPTFNSNAIEAFLFRIPGLSDRSLYANDDTFFSAPCKLSDFIDNQGRPRIRFSSHTHKENTPWGKMWQRTCGVIEREL